MQRSHAKTNFEFNLVHQPYVDSNGQLYVRSELPVE